MKTITPSSLSWSMAACATSAGAIALVAITSCHVCASISSSGRQRRHRGGEHQRVETTHRVDGLGDDLGAALGIPDVGRDCRCPSRRW